MRISASWIDPTLPLSLHWPCRSAHIGVRIVGPTGNSAPPNRSVRPMIPAAAQRTLHPVTGGSADSTGQGQRATRLTLLQSGQIDCPLRGSVALHRCLECPHLRALSTRGRPRVACVTDTLRILDVY